jgi:uncharacterized caspase-like protein
MHYVVRLVLLVCCAVAGLNFSPAEARRVALVIGNAEHKFLPVLKNPVNDATEVAATLENLNFDKVILKKDLGVEGFRAALRELSRDAKDAEAAVVFFAGNGIQVDGRNYLIPVDARLASVGEVEQEAVALQAVIEHVAEAKLGLIILDACRDNPFGGQTRGVHRGLGPRGLAQIDHPERGNLVLVYAALPGTVALDGIGRHSPFTEALLRHLPTPALELRQLLMRVRAEVVAATGGQQTPEVWDRAVREFFFAPAQR